jgi:hypothetical protein
MLKQETLVEVRVMHSGQLRVNKVDIVVDAQTGEEVDRGDLLTFTIEPGDEQEASAVLGDFAAKITPYWCSDAPGIADGIAEMTFREAAPVSVGR